MENKNDVLIDLGNLVDGLEKENNNCYSIVNKLQEIEGKLLCDCHLEINDIIIFPLLVEAYYKSECFDDKYTHGSPRQRDRFGKIYIHEIGYGGIDLCLSNKTEYALSFLIKNSLVRIPNKNSDGYYETFFTQTQLYDFLKNDNNCGFIEDKDIKGKRYYVLRTEARIIANNELNKKGDLIYLQRKGLETPKNIKENQYKDKIHYCCLLAAFSIKNIKDYPLTFENGKGNAVIEYIKTHQDVFEDNKKKIEFAREYSGYCPKDIKDAKV